MTSRKATFKNVKQNRIIAGIMIGLMLFVVALSVFYVIEEAGHDCHDEHCPICAYIHQFKTATENLALGLIGISTVISLALILRAVSASASKNYSRGTLIEQKIRINC